MTQSSHLVSDTKHGDAERDDPITLRCSETGPQEMTVELVPRVRWDASWQQAQQHRVVGASEHRVPLSLGNLQLMGLEI